MGNDVSRSVVIRGREVKIDICKKYSSFNRIESDFIARRIKEYFFSQEGIRNYVTIFDAKSIQIRINFFEKYEKISIEQIEKVIDDALKECSCGCFL